MALRRIRPMAPASGALQGFFDSAVMLPWNEFVERHAVQDLNWQRHGNSDVGAVCAQCVASTIHGGMAGTHTHLLRARCGCRARPTASWRASPCCAPIYARLAEAVLCEIALAEPARIAGWRRPIAYTRRLHRGALAGPWSWNACGRPDSSGCPISMTFGCARWLNCREPCRRGVGYDVWRPEVF